MQTISTTAITKEIQEPLPAFTKTSSGRSAMAPVGDMFATDWAKTSGKLRVFRRRVLAPAAPDRSPALSLCSTIFYSPLLLAVVVRMMRAMRRRDVEARVAVEESGGPELESELDH